MPKSYAIKKGDTLKNIARKNGLASWKNIYYAACNKRLRQVRPNPDKIKQGDIIIIPDNPEKLLRIKIAELQKTIDRIHATFNTSEQQLNADFAKLDREYASIMKKGQIADLSLFLINAVKGTAGLVTFKK